MPWYVYIIECRDNTLYTGITNNIAHRINDHNKGKGCKYTRFRNPVKLVYHEKYSTKSDALKREVFIKNLNKKNKLRLVGMS